MIPKQLAKDNNKFQYTLVEEKGTSKKYYGSIQWLIDSNIVINCSNVSLLELPLIGYTMENNFNLYFNDVGLLTTTYGYETKKRFY